MTYIALRCIIKEKNGNEVRRKQPLGRLKEDESFCCWASCWDESAHSLSSHGDGWGSMAFKTLGVKLINKGGCPYEYESMD